jgi:hypothetical protein
MRVINTNRERSNDFLLSGFDYTKNPDYNQRYLDEIYNDDNFFTMDGQISTFVKKRCLERIMDYFGGRIQAIPDPRFTELLKYELASAEYIFYQTLARDTMLKDAQGLFGGEWRRSTQDTKTDIDMTASSKTKQDSVTNNSLDSSTTAITGSQNVSDTSTVNNTGANTHSLNRFGEVVGGARHNNINLGGTDSSTNIETGKRDSSAKSKTFEEQQAEAKGEGSSTNRGGSITSNFPMSALVNRGWTVDTFLKGSSSEGASAGNAFKYASAGGQNLSESKNNSLSESKSSGKLDSEQTGLNKDIRESSSTQRYGKTETHTQGQFRDTNSDNLNESFNTTETTTGSSNRVIGGREDKQATGAVSSTQGSYNAGTDRRLAEDRKSQQVTTSEGSSKPFIELLNSLNDVTKGYKSAFELIQERLEPLWNQVFGTWYREEEDRYDDHYPL